MGGLPFDTVSGPAVTCWSDSELVSQFIIFSLLLQKNLLQTYDGKMAVRVGTEGPGALEGPAALEISAGAG